MGEVWLRVSGWNYYEVSSLGNIRSLDRIVPSKDGRTQIKRGRMLKPQNHRGYLAVTLKEAGTEKTIKVHALVLNAFQGAKPEGLEARHKNGTELDNRASNLVWGTRSENNLDRVTHGTHQNSIKVECPAGHPYNKINTYVVPKTGARKCRICKREAFLRFKAKENK